MLDRYSLLMIDFKHQKSIISRPAKKEAHMDGYKLGVRARLAKKLRFAAALVPGLPT